MSTRKRVFFGLAGVAVVGLGNVLAQPGPASLDQMQSGAPQANVAQQHTSNTTPAQLVQQRPRGPRHRVPSPANPSSKPVPDFGDPLPNLTAAQLAAFAEGLENFQARDDEATGLGPGFNDVSCVGCHSATAIGGASARFVIRFGRVENGHFDPLTESGGSALQQRAIDPMAQARVPARANVTTKRLTTPLFGTGLIEGIPDAAIIGNATRSKPDGVTGRASMVVDAATGQTRVGRFGWKAQQATLLSFAGDSYLNEMGITSRLFPKENAPNGDAALLAQYDLIVDPEDAVDPATGLSDIDHFANFMRLLAPPPQKALTASARAGQDLFGQIGCTACHRPAMTTGRNAVAALDRQAVRLYSDLLLHDMGSLGDGIAQGAAKMTEMRTAPLWGLRARGPYLHDGRAATVDAAIRAHGGEGARARDRYNRLSGSKQREILDFLDSI